MKAVILDGIVLGLGFGLLGVGLTLVYGLGGVLNLAYGEIAVFGASYGSRRERAQPLPDALLPLRAAVCAAFGLDPDGFVEALVLADAGDEPVQRVVAGRVGNRGDAR